MSKKTVRAFAPGAISSVFEIFNTNPDGTNITDLRYVGARGGGFGLQLGVNTKITIEDASENCVSVTINNLSATEEAKVTRDVAQTLLSKVDKKYAVIVEHKIDVPIGMGFGTSAGGALTTGIALKEALNLPLTFNQIGEIAHLTEIRLQTGLGTVSSLTNGGGLILVTEPGMPGICKIDRIPINPEYVLVAGFYNATISKISILSSEHKNAIKRYGKEALTKILETPCLENFLSNCWLFAQKTGFASDRVCELVNLAMQAGAIGATQNMIGEAVHAIVLKENATAVVEAFKNVLPEKQVLKCNIDFQGVRLIENKEETV
jgi:pantoate kinase